MLPAFIFKFVVRAQMEFKYALKGVDGNEEFVDGICLARQFVGRGKWFVWDMRREKSGKSCQACSSDAERIIIHDRGDRCPKNAQKEKVAAVRAEIGRAAKAARARLAVRAEG